MELVKITVESSGLKENLSLMHINLKPTRSYLSTVCACENMCKPQNWHKNMQQLIYQPDWACYTHSKMGVAFDEYAMWVFLSEGTKYWKENMQLSRCSTCSRIYQTFSVSCFRAYFTACERLVFTYVYYWETQNLIHTYSNLIVINTLYLLMHQ